MDATTIFYLGVACFVLALFIRIISGPRASAESSLSPLEQLLQAALAMSATESSESSNHSALMGGLLFFFVLIILMFTNNISIA